MLIAGVISWHAVTVQSQSISPAADSWGKAAPLLEAVGEQAVAQLDGKIYLIGGKLEGKGYLATVQVYDVATDTWEWGTPLPVAINHNVAVAVNGKIYSIGGQTQTQIAGGSPTDVTFEYDPSTKQWRTRAPLPSRRTASAVAVVNDKIYVVGGRTPPQGEADYDDFAVYDPATDIWTRLPRLPTRRHHLNAVAIGGKIYVAGGSLIVGSGGYADSGGTTNVLDIFDPATNTWSQGQPMPTAREAASGIVANGCFHIFAGEVPDADVLLPHEVYNPVTDTWTKMPDNIPIPMNGISPSGGGFENGIIYLPGGTTTPGGMQIDVLQTFRPTQTCQ
jgi:N-acetylneuraminic acid mutarotase